MNLSPPIPLVILGVPFHPVTNAETLDCCVEHIRNRIPGYVTTPNLDFLMQAQGDPELARILAQSDLVIADGMPIIWLSGKLGPKLPERVAGSDLVVMLAEAAARHAFRVFHLGGAPGVPEKAGKVLAERFPGFQLAGAYSPPKADIMNMDHETILHKLEESAPDILFVAFGAPKQEKWINLHVRTWHVPLALGIGGSLDFLSGTQKRAPKWMQKSGIEWIWRMSTDPKRLWRRYWNNGRFLIRALAEIRSIRCLPDTPLPAILPDTSEGKDGSRLHLVRWQPLPDLAAAGQFLSPFLDDPAPRPLMMDFTGCAWLSSLELGVLVTMGRHWKRKSQLIFRTGASTKIDHWLRFNLMDSLLEPATEHTCWDQRLAAQTAPGKTGTSSKDQATSDPQSRHLYPPEELTALTVGAWRETVEKILRELPQDTQTIILEAAELRFLDSAGLGFFMYLKKRTDELGHRFEIHDLHGAPLTTLKLARVETLLPLSSQHPVSGISSAE